MRRIIIVIILLMGAGFAASAQKVTIGTNLVQLADIGTINLEAHYAFGQHVTLGLGGRYNRWDVHRLEENHFLNRKRSAWLGVKYWPWHVYSGWYIMAKGQWQEYNRKFFMDYKSQGDEYGGGLGLGYCFMLSPHFNLEVGASVWGGIDYYEEYTKAERGRFITSGQKWFVLPDDLSVSIYYIF